MKHKIRCTIGDKVQARNGRIGAVIALKPILDRNGVEFPNCQKVVVKFLDGSTTEGIAEDFQALLHKPPGM
jgi:hypothetical protein